MTPATKKTGTRKAKRVSTVFIGATAAATAFVPAAQAHAGTGATARQHELTYNQHLAGPHGIRPMSIVERNNCPGGTSNWYHVGFFKEEDTCFGFTGVKTGTLSRPIYYATSYCGGNNSGFISGYLTGDNNAHWSHFWGHGTTYFHIPHTSQLGLAVTHLSMYGWSQNDKCAFP